MRLLEHALQKIEFNINHAQDINSNKQQELRLGNTQFINDMAKELKLSPESAGVAILYVQLFYLDKSYLEHERELICCACLFVACKLMY
jgi:hypothetical protein